MNEPNPVIHDARWVSNRRFLSLKGVRVYALDASQGAVGTVASGFIRREPDGYYLYTCWHVVTGYDPYDVRVGMELPHRRFLRIELQDASEQEFSVTIGGSQAIVIPLYEDPVNLRTPLWLQDRRHVPHPDLNAVGLHVPFWFDAVKLRLPDDIRLSSLQVVMSGDNMPGNTLLAPGDKVYVTGFPHGYSALGHTQPTPIVLTRFVASTAIYDRRCAFLLESPGAPGMSGGAVFLERGHNLHLLGMYTGAIFPDYREGHHDGGNDRHAALGSVADMTMLFMGHLEFVREPDQTDG